MLYGDSVCLMLYSDFVQKVIEKKIVTFIC
jgi:hypothetical protein